MILCLSCIWFTCNNEIKALADGNEQGLMGYSAGVLISRVIQARLQIEEGWERVCAILMKSMTGVQNILEERRRRAAPRCFTVPFNVYIQWIVPFCITYQLLVLTKCHRQGGAHIYRHTGLFCGVWKRKKETFKWVFHHLFTLMLFQTCMTFFLHWKNILAVFIHAKIVNGVQNNIWAHLSLKLL